MYYVPLVYLNVNEYRLYIYLYIYMHLIHYLYIYIYRDWWNNEIQA